MAEMVDKRNKDQKAQRKYGRRGRKLPAGQSGAGLPHYQSAKSARDATWRIVTIDPNFGEGTF